MKLQILSIKLREEIFDALVAKLGSREPLIRGSRRAAVSVILSRKVAPRVLLIKRSEREGDPWSGQVAFPGGKFQEGDASLRATAVREAREEVGFDLDVSSEFLGYFGTFRTHTGDMEVVPSVFLLKGEVSVRVNGEATSYMWVPLEDMLSDEAKSDCEVQVGGAPRVVPAFRVGEYVIWGLTHRIILSLIGGNSA